MSALVLPKTYNTIEETDEYFILNKRIELPLVGTFPFKQHVWVEIGSGPNNRMYIRRIAYHKSDYEREFVEAVQESTAECPYCVRGKNVLVWDEAKHKYVEKHEVREGHTMNTLEKIEQFFKQSEGGHGLTIQTQAAGAGISWATGLFYDWVGRWSWVSRVLKGVTGAAALGGYFYLKGKAPVLPDTRLHGLLRSVAFPSLVSALDPRPEQIRQLRREVEEAKSYLNLGPGELLKAAFVNPIEQVKLALGPTVFRNPAPEMVERMKLKETPTDQVRKPSITVRTI